MTLHETDTYFCRRSCNLTEPKAHSEVFEFIDSSAIDRCEVSEKASDKMKAVEAVQFLRNTLKKMSLSFIEDVQCTDTHKHDIHIHNNKDV